MRLFITIAILVFLTPSCFAYSKVISTSNDLSGDENNIRKKAAKLLARLKKGNDSRINSGKDTLIDLNGDHQKDLLIEFYYGSGTGLKNGTLIYLFDKKKSRFIREPLVFPNPTFYFKNKTVVSYYIALGGGSAYKFKWNGLKLDTLEKIDVDVSGWETNLKFEIKMHNCVTGKTRTEINDMMYLPKEYNYCDYTPIIKKEY